MFPVYDAVEIAINLTLYQLFEKICSYNPSKLTIKYLPVQQNNSSSGITSK